MDTFLISDSEFNAYLEGKCGGSWIDSGHFDQTKRAVKADKQVKLNAISEYQNSLKKSLNESLVFTKQFAENWKEKLSIDATGIDKYVNEVKQNIERFELHLA